MAGEAGGVNRIWARHEPLDPLQVGQLLRQCGKLRGRVEPQHDRFRVPMFLRDWCPHVVTDVAHALGRREFNGDDSGYEDLHVSTVATPAASVPAPTSRWRGAAAARAHRR